MKDILEIIIAILTVIFGIGYIIKIKSKKISQKQKSGDNSKNIQIVNINDKGRKNDK